MGFVCIYIKNISEFTESHLPVFAGRISPARQEILENRKNPTDKIRCCVAEMLLWTGLTELGLDIHEFSVDYDKDGNEKPRLDPPILDFSFSHSGDYVVCAISDAPIGVDVQEKTKRGAILSHHVFSEAELARISEADFYDAWTCKEAFIKCAAEEHPSLRSAELDLGQMPYPIINRSDSHEFYFHTETLGSGHTLTYCVHTKAECHFWAREI